MRSALFRGEPLAGLPGPFAQAERQRLRELRRTVQRNRLECLLTLGRSADALDELTTLAASMRALYGGERQAEALNAYQDMRVRLRDELGVDPGEELRRVHEAVLRQDNDRLVGPSCSAPRPSWFSRPGTPSCTRSS
ncbi:AfsR/SARP family transcriptional regulator [Streptomyces sp. HD]|uniref:AfsR/SARP family transcriptional regulator n=1 Tax=Streptomyces sp. HD TaxID=3020892 RepID=UPI0023305ECD|nr:AfsR/SARP family transcriptional regulator [Streptomyces sp. HD]MDC0773991.1 AfsR/SARP family transcriptional regulator [Streptomyces sp. HD]